MTYTLTDRQFDIIVDCLAGSPVCTFPGELAELIEGLKNQRAVMRDTESVDQVFLNDESQLMFIKNNIGPVESGDKLRINGVEYFVESVEINGSLRRDFLGLKVRKA